jgi:hypothetical protein
MLSTTLYCSDRICSHCGQGRLFVFKNTSAEQLYLHCAECEYGWDDAERWHDQGSGFLTLTEEFEAVPASWVDIEDQCWQRYASQELHE